MTARRWGRQATSSNSPGRDNKVSANADYDVIIAGCGPAGAWVLRNLPAGMRILAVDAGDPLDTSRTPKLCGGLLTKQAQALLPGLPEHVRAVPFRAGLEMHDLDNRFRARFPVEYANCKRGELDAWLLRIALESRGADVAYEPNTKVEGVREVGGAVDVSIGPGTVRAEWLIDCTGWRQLARKCLKLPPVPHMHSFQAQCSTPEAYPHFISVFKTSWTPFFGWYIPKSAGECEVGAAFAPGERGSAAQRLEPLFAHLRSLRIDAQPVEYRGCRLAGITGMRDIQLGSGRILICGEAAGLVSPSSGDGISFALASGRAAAMSLGVSPEAAQQVYRRLLSPELTELARNAIKARQSRNPFMRRLGAQALMVKYRGRTVRLSL